jgi:hypothetical protein
MAGASPFAAQAALHAGDPEVTSGSPQNEAWPLEHAHMQWLVQPPPEHPPNVAPATSARAAIKTRGCMVLNRVFMTDPQRTVVQEMN